MGFRRTTSAGEGWRPARRLPALPCALLVAGASSVAIGATPAGAPIVNRARVAYTLNGVAGEGETNTVQDRAAEVLDVAVVAPIPQVQVRAGDLGRVVAFKVTNTGNGSEAFSLAASADTEGQSFVPAIRRVVLDADGNGALDAGDPAYVSGSNDPVLGPGRSVTVFVVCDIPDLGTGSGQGAITLTATALTGSGRPGTVFPGKGDEGADAVVGQTTAQARAPATLSFGTLHAEIVKSQTVLDPAGGSAVVPGSVVTYSLEARVTGVGALTAASIDDPLPAGVTYVPGGLKLDGTPFAEGGHVDATGVHVALGPLAAPASHTVSFQVRIN